MSREIWMRTSHLLDIASCKFLALAILKPQQKPHLGASSAEWVFRSPEVGHLPFHWSFCTAPPRGQLRKFNGSSALQTCFWSQDKRLQKSLSPLMSSAQPSWQTMPRRSSWVCLQMPCPKWDQDLCGWCLGICILNKPLKCHLAHRKPEGCYVVACTPTLFVPLETHANRAQTGELGGLPSMGSHRVGHDWSDLAAVASLIYARW